MRLLHIEYSALLLVDERAVDDDAFEFVQFEGSRLDQIGDSCGCTGADAHAVIVS